ncbi:MAG: hypothetical protein IKA71_04975 [Lentisphaeria bacterium]|nr:hypothetical protein [Lentisphaeria bacterium]
MIKTAKYFLPASSVRSRIEEQVRREWKRFSAMLLVYVLLIIAAVIVGARGEYNLHGDSINGFALWFLLLPAYLPLAIVSTFTWYFGYNIPLAGNEAYWLGACNLIQVFLVWAILSLIAFKSKRPMLLRNAVYFIRILVFWGVFQLVCCAGRGLWENGGFMSLHHDTSSVIADQK